MNEQPGQKVPPARLTPQPWMVAPETAKVMAALMEKGGAARFVGGAVRDAVLNRRVIDIDIATPLLPDDVMARLAAHKIQYVPTGLQHGTVTAIADGKPFEITTLRRDTVTHGRKADVTFTQDWKQDASRRDFTMNALYADMSGEIFDYFGGLSDLQAGRVAFIGNAEARIHEDHLRILRFFRFFAHYGRGDADPPSLAASIRLAHLIPTLSRERIRQEVLKLLESDRAGLVWHIMFENGVTTHFLPEATGAEALDRVIALEQKLQRGSYGLRHLATLLDITVEGLKRVSEHLRLSRDQARLLAAMVVTSSSVMKGADEKTARALAYRYGADLAESILLVAAAKGGAFDLDRLHQAASSFRPPRFPVTGEDLTARGLSPGPKLGEILKALEQEWVAGDFTAGRMALLQRLDEKLGKKA